VTNPFEKPKAPPIMPPWLAKKDALEPARLVWRENLERVVAAGCKEADSDLFARYCCLEAWHRGYVDAMAERPLEYPDPPSAAHIEALLRMAERLGLAGPTSRKSAHHLQVNVQQD